MTDHRVNPIHLLQKNFFPTFQYLRFVQTTITLVHLSPKSLLELFSPRRVAALAMRPRLPLPLRRLLRAAASCRRRLLLPDAPCRRLLLQPQLAAA